VPIDVTLAPTIEQFEFEGDLFGNGWKLRFKEGGTTALETETIADQSTREFRFCVSATPTGEIFNVGVHPRPQPSPSRVRKHGRRR
jgi:hypothetical protein